MKNTTMNDAVVMVKKWAEKRKGYGMELSDCFWDLDTLLVEEYGMCGEWYGSNETEPTPKQYRKLKDVIAEVFGYKRDYNQKYDDIYSPIAGYSPNC